jgi:phospholipid N-methyltransferase
MKDAFTVSDRGSSAGPAANGRRNGKLRLRNGFSDRIRFLGAFLRRPTSVGALAPSSPHLARAMVNGRGIEDCSTVVELGPGTGAFTKLILNTIGNKTTFFALELDPGLTRNLKRRFPGLVVYNESAEKIPEYLARHGRGKADYIVSGLPWASLPLDVQDRIFRAVLDSLDPGGVIVTFGYVHARWFPNAQRFRCRLERSFKKVELSRVVWRNIPPAFIYRCTR